MKKYEAPIAEIKVFQTEDVLDGSALPNYNQGSDSEVIIKSYNIFG